MTTIAIANTKGGTGKTTTALNLSTELGRRGKQVLLIDLDPQASLSKAVLGEQQLPDYKGIEEIMAGKCDTPHRFIAETKIDNVYIIPSHAELNEISLKLVMKASFFALKDGIQPITGFDFVILDTQPSKNILMLNAFSASDYVLIPTNPGVYPLMDIVELEETIKETACNSNSRLSILGVLVTMVPQGIIYRQLEKDLRGYFGKKVFTTTISRLVKSEESAVEGIGITLLDPESKLAGQYQSLTDEILNRIGQGA